MDELEILKTHWKKEQNPYPRLTYNELYRMILQKSSSIVKWIFIISIIEFLFWIGISFFVKDSTFHDDVNDINLDSVLIPISIISYIVLFYFFYLFYKNYKTISATDNAKTLMENIIKTRKTVKYYVIFNLVTIIIGVVFGTYHVLNNVPVVVEKIELASANNQELAVYASFILGVIIVLLSVIVLLILFYWLIYGLLLRRLNNNYNELMKLDSN